MGSNPYDENCRGDGSASPPAKKAPRHCDGNRRGDGSASPSNRKDKDKNYKYGNKTII